ncbi:MgtC/SapB family protein [Agrilactobacillus composti]|nr:MgtC/SapB family protein [Agrilactobacillus composti]
MRFFWLFQLEWCLRLIVAAICGGLVGFERKARLKTAGTRTHMLVAVGSALFMLVSKYGFFDVLNRTNMALDPSRIAAQVVSGIGFIGAGTILTRHHQIDGLTTAAGLWATAAIGLAIGADMYVIGIAGTLCILTTQTMVRHIKALRNSSRYLLQLQVTMTGQLQEMDKLPQQLADLGCATIKMAILSYNPKNYTLSLMIKLKKHTDPTTFIRKMSALSHVKSIDVIDL